VRLGRQGEALAAAHLQRCGFEILARNHRTRHGEIDLIAFDGVTLVFAEVKTRRARMPGQRGGRGGAGAAPHPPALGWPAMKQRRRLRRVAVEWLCDGRRSRPLARDIRFDVLRVLIADGGRLLALEHVEGA
jgi:putative endonuclease